MLLLWLFFRLCNQTVLPQTVLPPKQKDHVISNPMEGFEKMRPLLGKNSGSDRGEAFSNSNRIRPTMGLLSRCAPRRTYQVSLLFSLPFLSPFLLCYLPSAMFLPFAVSLSTSAAVFFLSNGLCSILSLRLTISLYSN